MLREIRREAGKVPEAFQTSDLSWFLIEISSVWEIQADLSQAWLSEMVVENEGAQDSFKQIKIMSSWAQNSNCNSLLFTNGEELII